MFTPQASNLQDSKLQQTARKLGLSVKTLEQYMAAKTAEVAPRQHASNSHR
jgi:hypothetical protein